MVAIHAGQYVAQEGDGLSRRRRGERFGQGDATDAVAGALIVTELADGQLASRVESSAGSPDGARRGVSE